MAPMVNKIRPDIAILLTAERKLVGAFIRCLLSVICGLTEARANGAISRNPHYQKGTTTGALGPGTAINRSLPRLPPISLVRVDAFEKGLEKTGEP